jgi:hypothetical protein
MVKGKIRFYRKREFLFWLVREWSGPERRWIDESIREEDKSENGKSSITESSSPANGGNLIHDRPAANAPWWAYLFITPANFFWFSCLAWHAFHDTWLF